MPLFTVYRCSLWGKMLGVFFLAFASPLRDFNERRHVHFVIHTTVVLAQFTKSRYWSTSNIPDMGYQ
jgi:hypothetical protein